MKVLKAQSGSPVLLTVKDVGVLLSISRASVYRLVEKRLIPFYKLRSGLRFRVEDVESYLDGCRYEAFTNKNEYGDTKG